MSVIEEKKLCGPERDTNLVLLFLNTLRTEAPINYHRDGLGIKFQVPYQK
jgi:hypothetical protein